MALIQRGPVVLFQRGPVVLSQLGAELLLQVGGVLLLCQEEGVQASGMLLLSSSSAIICTFL